jgi:para-nitrobenzyl esterase
MPYIFADDTRRTPADNAVAARQQDYWYNFIAHGDPNMAGLPDWPRAKPDAIAPLLIDEQNRIVPGLHGNVMAVWHERWQRENEEAILL